MQLLGLDTPQLEVENKIYPFVEPNPWYVILWSAIPVLLFTRNLLWGTLYGLVGFSINLRAFHTERKMWVKYLITGAISVGWILFFILFEPAILFPLPSK